MTTNLPPFINIKDLTINFGGKKILEQVNLEINKGEHWAITGESGSGKTMLANAIAGKCFFLGEITYAEHLSIDIVEQQHHFKNLSNTSQFYYQQRYNATESEDSITVSQHLSAHADLKENERWIKMLGLEKLMDKPLLQLSNGENKRLQIASVLAKPPHLLILDNPFTGLDTAGRSLLTEIVKKITAAGIQVILITHPAEIPESISHIAVLENGHLASSGAKHLVIPLLQKKNVNKHPNLSLLKHFKKEDHPFSFAVRFINLHIRYGTKQIFEQFNWEVRKGEQWGIWGPNGSGKSTLLSLIYADNPQAYANEIYLFDRKRGSGESIWDIKRHIGFLSPELHLHFETSTNCFEVVASGLFDTIGLFRKLSAEQEERVEEIMILLDVQKHSKQRLEQLSTGQQRLVLLGRAIIKNPALLLLDEPCQGLDDNQSEILKTMVAELCLQFGTTLIYISHYRNEFPSVIGDNILALNLPDEAV
ncbi:MAG: ATP-binding cassette domain-containing protein [Gemmatimonadaceae bacterium]|nr:ATP-binding cassette domain-containing protein [Chitinophagaceae bacterium]